MEKVNQYKQGIVKFIFSELVVVMSQVAVFLMVAVLLRTFLIVKIS